MALVVMMAATTVRNGHDSGSAITMVGDGSDETIADGQQSTIGEVGSDGGDKQLKVVIWVDGGAW